MGSYKWSCKYGTVTIILTRIRGLIITTHEPKSGPSIGCSGFGRANQHHPTEVGGEDSTGSQKNGMGVT